MANSHHFTPPRQVSARWRRLCEALLSSPSRSSDTPFSAASCMSDICRRYKGRFSLNMNIKSVIVFADIGCADSDVRSLNTTIVEGPIERHKITASFTRDRRRAHWHRERGNHLRPERIGGEMVARSACSFRQEGSPWKGKAASSSSITHSPCLEM